MAEWFADESFWQTFYPYMFDAERFERAEGQVDDLLALTGFEGSDVLDLCCGPGRHSTLLAERGFRVTGVDRSVFLLDKAREHAAERGVDVEWIEEDMRDFVRAGAYDLVVNLFTSFGYFDDKDDDVRVLRNIHESLRPGGLFVIDILGKERLARILLETTSTRTPDGALMVERHEVFDDWSRVRNEWVLVKDGAATTFHFHHTIYSAQELKDRLYQVGFERTAVYGDLEGSPYDHTAQRLVILAWKASDGS